MTKRFVSLAVSSVLFVSIAKGVPCPDPEIRLSDFRATGFKSHTQAEFLKTLKEKKSLFSTFTFVVRSNGSFLEAGISEEYPGPIAMSRDGSMFIRWSCDPNSPVYGVVEMYQFNNKRPPDGPYQSLRLDYRPNQHHSDDIKTCLKCHANIPAAKATASDFSPIWNGYSEWRHEGGSDNFEIMGADDDLLIPSPEYVNSQFPRMQQNDIAFKKRQRNMLKTIKTKVAGNRVEDCYSVLPWTDTNPETLSPYDSVYKKSPPTKRPNLSITEAIGGQMVQSVFPRVTGNRARVHLFCELNKNCSCHNSAETAKFCEILKDDNFFEKPRHPQAYPKEASTGFTVGNNESLQSNLRMSWIQAAIKSSVDQSFIQSHLVKKISTRHDEYPGDKLPPGCADLLNVKIELAQPDSLTSSEAVCNWFDREWAYAKTVNLKIEDPIEFITETATRPTIQPHGK